VAGLQNARLVLALTIVSLYMLLEAAFMLVRFPPGSVAAVPTGEILIVIFALTLVLDRGNFAPFARAVPLLPLAVWWAIGFTQLAIGFLEHGFWALRDGTSLVESLYLWIGFTVAALPAAIPRIARWYAWVLALGALIALTFPFRETIRELSPQIVSAVGVATPLFFTYQFTAILSLTCAAWLIATGRKVMGLPPEWIAAALMIFVAALFQARTIYLQIMFLGIWLALLHTKTMARALLPMGIAATLFLLLVALGVPIPGRISQDVSLDFYLDHFMAIFGGSSERTGLEHDAVVGAAGGVSQRLNWWSAIWNHVTETWQTSLFGLGYGVSLVGLANDPWIDPAVREPHNSMISAFGRTGFLGVTAYAALHLSLAITALRTWWHYHRNGHTEAARLIYVLGAMFGLFWIAAIGEDAFEKPFLAIPYYFFYGVILNMYARAEGLASTPAFRPPMAAPELVRASR
jgi:hypothetical protein